LNLFEGLGKNPLHTFLHLVDTHYRQIRAALGARHTFFEDARSLMRWQIFEDWEAFIHFMTDRLELDRHPIDGLFIDSAGHNR
jgi:hypothetical protein